jgi:hypothetical protein
MPDGRVYICQTNTTRMTMRAYVLASLLIATLPDAWATDNGAAPARQSPSMRDRLDDDAIRKAVRETLAEMPAPMRDRGPVLRGDSAHDRFERQVDDARVPGCWGPDALKHQPPRIGPIGLGGILALPFWGAAIVTGKCN